MGYWVIMKWNDMNRVIIVREFSSYKEKNAVRVHILGVKG